MYRLDRQLRVPGDQESVFEFFADARNLEAITPPWLSFRIVTPGPIDMRVGARIRYRLNVHGIPMGWESEITAWDPPHRFVDEQRRGPYRAWIHEHRFRADGGSTWVEDRVDYTVPGGSLVHRWLVRPDVERIFDYRHQQLLERFEAPEAGLRNAGNA